MKFTGTPNTDTWAGFDYLQFTGDTYHPGIDYNYGGGEQDKGLPVLSIGNGMVEKTIFWDGVTTGFGNHVFVKHTLPDQSIMYSHYCHLDSITCKEGQDINIGDEVGKCGGSGGWPSHLHFEVRPPLGKGYEFWPKGMSKDWVASHYVDPFGFIEKRKAGSVEGTLPVKISDFETLRRKSDGYDKVREKLNVADSEVIILQTIDNLMRYEDLVSEKEEALSKAQAKIVAMKKQIDDQAKENYQNKMDAGAMKKELTKKLQDLQDLVNSKTEEYQTAMVKMENKNAKLLMDLNALKAQCKFVEFKGIKKTIYNWLISQ